MQKRCIIAQGTEHLETRELQTWASNMFCILRCGAGLAAIGATVVRRSGGGVSSGGLLSAAGRAAGAATVGCDAHHTAAAGRPRG